MFVCVCVFGEGEDPKTPTAMCEGQRQQMCSYRECQAIREHNTLTHTHRHTEKSREGKHFSNTAAEATDRFLKDKCTR